MSGGDVPNERLKVSSVVATMRKEISANSTMDALNMASRRPPHGRRGTHLASDSFQCYRFSNLGLIWMLLLLVLVSLGPVNGKW